MRPKQPDVGCHSAPSYVYIISIIIMEMQNDKKSMHDHANKLIFQLWNNMNHSANDEPHQANVC